MPIKSVDDFIGAVSDEGTIPKRNSTETPEYETNVEWGPPTSLAGGDAASRLGISLGSPTDTKVASMIKTSAVFHGASYWEIDQQRRELVKEAMAGAAVVQGARTGAQAVGRVAGKYLPRIFGGAASRIGAAGTAAKTTTGRLGQFFGRNVLPQGSRSSTFLREAPGMAFDATNEVYDVAQAAKHHDPAFTQATGWGKPTSAIQGR